jgi:hypothetical protein
MFTFVRLLTIIGLLDSPGRPVEMRDPHFVTPAAPNFDFEGLLKASLALESAASIDPDPFSLSPLSSPDVTPAQSPSSSATSTPLQSPARKPSPLPMDAIATQQDATATRPRAKESATRKERKKAESRANRRARRRENRKQHFAPDTREAVVDKYVKEAVPLASGMDVEAANVAKTAFVAIDDRVRSRKAYQLGELVGTLGFKLVEWDGRHVYRFRIAIFADWDLGPPPPSSMSAANLSVSSPGTLAPPVNGLSCRTKLRVPLRMHATGQRSRTRMPCIGAAHSRCCVAAYPTAADKNGLAI